MTGLFILGYFEYGYFSIMVKFIRFELYGLFFSYSLMQIKV